jgi:regulator of protease activity HflC (stomatin/prohibitin superfamily)
MFLTITLISISLVVLFFLTSSIFVVRQAEAIIIERLGRYHCTLRPGIHFVLPFINSVRRADWSFLESTRFDSRDYRKVYKSISRIDLRESLYDFPRQNVITKDNVTLEINALLYYHITDPKLAIYAVQDLPDAIEKLTQTTLRNVIGSMDLDETLVSRDVINTKLRIILDEASESWGVKVSRVELQEINPPHDIKEAMEKQMRAERDRRAVILSSEGKKRAAILEAEGEQESAILRAKGQAEAKIISAVAEAEALKTIQNAVPSGNPLSYLIANNYIKALSDITSGKDNKLVIVPIESAGLTGAVSQIKEIFKS